MALFFKKTTSIITNTTKVICHGKDNLSGCSLSDEREYKMTWYNTIYSNRFTFYYYFQHIAKH